MAASRQKESGAKAPHSEKSEKKPLRISSQGL
jgi:hypothetical protein